MTGPPGDEHVAFAAASLRQPYRNRIVFSAPAEIGRPLQEAIPFGEFRDEAVAIASRRGRDDRSNRGGKVAQEGLPGDICVAVAIYRDARGFIDWFHRSG